MLRKKHSPFTYKQIGVFIFLLLNCFLTTVPFIKATAENSHYAVTAGFSSQHGPAQDSEENSRSNYPGEQLQYHIALGNKQRVVQVSSIPRCCAVLRNNNIDESDLSPSFASSLIIVRPAYYAFLSLYTLV